MKLKNDFRDLKVWQKCRDIRVAIWKLCKKFSAQTSLNSRVVE